MTMRNLLSYSVFAFAFVLVISCQDQQLETTGEVYLDLPPERFQYNNNLNDTANAITTLGRVLFYDRNLSTNSTIACASCHKQSYGFADNQRFSQGFAGRFTTRNSMPVQNLSASGGLMDATFAPDKGQFGGHLFWDGREALLQNLVLQPIGNHIEMGVADAQSLTDKLSTLSYYSSLFKDAYGSSEITTEGISRALTSFCLSINTNDTRFDKYNQTRFVGPLIDFDSVTVTPPDAQQPVLNALEIEGMLLFEQKYNCNSCHNVGSTNGYLFAGTFANIGLDKEYSDLGRQKVTNDPLDNGKFKIPSLRNVVYTAPYMHDGRYANLKEVMEHYSEGIEDTPNLDQKLKGADGHARTMNISEHEKEAIIAFLNTLTDDSVITDPKFSDPFKVK
jgi:cytochrome c peroxidase